MFRNIANHCTCGKGVAGNSLKINTKKAELTSLPPSSSYSCYLEAVPAVIIIVLIAADQKSHGSVDHRIEEININESDLEETREKKWIDRLSGEHYIS